MKKLILVCSVALLTLASCVKDYTCECVINGEVVSTTTIKDKKSKAQDLCDANDASAFGYTQNCTIK